MEIWLCIRLTRDGLSWLFSVVNLSMSGVNYNPELIKVFWKEFEKSVGPGVVVHAFSSSTPETEACRSLSSRPVYRANSWTAKLRQWRGNHWKLNAEGDTTKANWTLCTLSLHLLSTHGWICSSPQSYRHSSQFNPPLIHTTVSIPWACVQSTLQPGSWACDS